jgi:hypothetical protein
MELLQADHLNEVMNNESKSHSMRYYATVEAEWLHEFLMDLSVVEKSSIPDISMNYDS